MWDGVGSRRYGAGSVSVSPSRSRSWSRSHSRSRSREHHDGGRDRRRMRERDRSFSSSRSMSSSRDRERSRTRSRDRSRSRSRSRSAARGRPDQGMWQHDRFKELEKEREMGSRYDDWNWHGYDGRFQGRRHHRDYHDYDRDYGYGRSYYNYRDSPSKDRYPRRYGEDDFGPRFGEWGYYKERERERSPSNWRGRKERPSSILYLKGIPLERDEADLYKLFEGMPGKLESIRIMRDRATGQSRGFAFLDYASVKDAQMVMECEAKYDLEMDGTKLYLEYSSTSGQLPCKQSSGSAHLDWVCNMCGAVNFARRLECYQCCAPRSKDAQRVSSEPDGPSCILKVSGLEPQTSEDALNDLFLLHAQVKEIRMVLDRFTSAPRGFAFVHFHTVADASRMLNMFQGHVMNNQKIPLKLCFARDRLSAATGTAANAAAAAVEAAQAMQQYSNWEPKEFDEQAAKINPAKEENGQSKEKDNNGFVYHAESGYYYHKSTGYYYDANTQMYFDNSRGEWLMYDTEKEQYVPYSATSENKKDEKPTPSVSTAAENAVEATNAAVKEVKKQDAQRQVGQVGQGGRAVRRRGATIGAAPQLNPEGLLAQAKAEEEERLMRNATAAASTSTANSSQNASKPRNKPRNHKNQKSGNKKIPPQQTGVAAALSRMMRGNQKAQAIQSTVKSAGSTGGTVQGLGPNAVQGTQKRVQGVIRGGKWSGGIKGGQ